MDRLVLQAGASSPCDPDSNPAHSTQRGVRKTGIRSPGAAGTLVHTRALGMGAIADSGAVQASGLGRGAVALRRA
ncbi:unnamed protein product [Boreogadus saida]